MEDAQFLEELYNIVKQNKKEAYPRIIAERPLYPLLYHLSGIRENLIDWIPMTKEMCVLERNAECGALTGKLLEKAGEVVSLTWEEAEARIIRARYPEVGDRLRVFLDETPVPSYLQVREHFDVILIAGDVYRFCGELAKLGKLLKADGRLIIADANRLGLKYFAGCQEEYRGGYFTGVEGYESEAAPCAGREPECRAEAGKCFTKKEYVQLLKAAGFEHLEFYYPYPDYKFPNVIYSDDWLPGKGELSDNRRNFDRDRIQLFDERRVYDTLLEEGLFGTFSNSFLIAARKQEERAIG